MISSFLFASLLAFVPQKFEDHSIYPPDPSTGAYFAHGVGVDGNLAVVGSSRDSEQATAGGSAYVYIWDDNQGKWTFLQKLLPTDFRAHMKFGMFVWADDVNGRIAVGARGDDPDGPTSGSVYLFKRNANSGIFEFEQKLLRSDGGPDQHYGSSVILDGDWAMVGCYKDDDNGHYSGSVYFWKLNKWNGTWNMKQKLTAYDGEDDDKFGRYNHLRNGVAVIGASRDDNNGEDSGSAYIYRLGQNGKFTLEDHIFANDAGPGGRFGISSWVDGDVAIFGSYWDDTQAGMQAGSAYIFRRDSNGDWQQEDKLVAEDGHKEQFFGCYVHISGNTAYVGAYGDSEYVTNGGAVYVFRRKSNGGWKQVNKLVAWNVSFGDNSGRFFDVSDGNLLMGSRFDDGAGTDVGAAVEFRYASFHVQASSNTPQAGKMFGITLTGGEPSRQAVLFADYKRDGRTYMPGHNVLLDLLFPNIVGSAKLIDASGSAQWAFALPMKLSGAKGYFQIASVGVKSNRLLIQVQ